MPGTNGLTKGKLFASLFSSGCFTEVATYFKSHWKHCLSIESSISPIASRGEEDHVHEVVSYDQGKT